MRALLCLFALLGAVGGLSAQTKSPTAAPAPVNEDRFVDELLAQPAVDLAHAAWLTGRAAGTFDESVTPDAAGPRALAAGWASPPLTPASALTWQTYSQVLVRAWQVPTGLVYGWFPTPRYALRELQFRRIVPPGLNPEGPVSGEEAMRVLQSLQDWKEAQK